MNGDKVILHLCADTGSDTKPYKDAGYNVILVGSDIGVENYHPPKDVYGIIANPPCTEFSIARSGGKPRLGADGLFLVKECQRIIAECKANGDLQFWVIENPATGALKNYLGKPDYVYQPWWFGSPWTKKTALWGWFNEPERVYQNWEDVPKIEGLYHRKNRNSNGLYQMHKSAYHLIPEFAGLPVPESDMEFRSLCSQKFAQAFYKANK
ncbi:MAG: hypothetical protein WC657_06450 [Candidatus Paceibacterota bacterium]|jgi:hypothetical protein